MLSYRHAFHAGNHADVLKHFVLKEVLQYTAQKDKPFWYIDTHAGAGMYALDRGYAQQNAEFRDGIERLWNSPELPASLADYLALIRDLNKKNELRLYPGSPAIARALLRPDDRLRLLELHPNDSKLLRQEFLVDKPLSGRQIMIETHDGFAGLKAMLPPPPKRAVVLIDPPYEDKSDYRSVVNAIEDSLKRFPIGTFMIWYPMLQRPEPRQMLDKLARLQPQSWLQIELQVQTPSLDGFGMHGSGLFIINPPWTLPKILSEVMPSLVKILGQNEGAEFRLESRIP
ncbi:MAG TPA: 23S rRNA (adenine(2030)-N(6))-methyltransferase RlmJ [Methylophilaceae bacterium]|nr:23S rRNA (adenine(2030)-N(6))-methyltransferase RlmJ [Methylophilaceae bacterium]